ncbi:MAG TPA: MlaD family protein [Gemmataceae bacterium]|nr:MlaD family protein [Gemmataceae bacterium]
MNEQAIRFRVGVFVLAALILLGVLIILFAGQPAFLRSQAEYSIILNDATGISPGTPVRRAGVRIGEVKRFDLDDATGKVKVIVAVDKDHPPMEGDEAVVARGILGGDTHIDLVPAPEEPAGKKLNQANGPPLIFLVADPPPSQPRKPLPPGTEIPSAPGAAAGNLANQAATLIPPMQKTLAQMQKTLDDYDRLTAEFNKAIREYTALARSVNQTIPAVRQTNDQVRDAARSVNRLGDRLDKLVAANGDKLTKALDNLNSSLGRINNTFNEENQRNLATSLKNAREGSERLLTVTKDTDALIQESRETIRRVNGEILRTDAVLSNLQQATVPLAQRSASVMQNLDQGSVRFNAAMTSLQALLQGVGKPTGTLGLLLNDPTLYNNLNSAACMLDRILPRVDRMIKDLDVFADKIARHPESLGLGGVLRPSSGLKQSPFNDSSFGPHH